MQFRGSRNTGSDSGIANFLSENISASETVCQDSGKKATNYERSKAVDIIALDLCDKLGDAAHDHYEYYCKVAWRLQPAVIYSNLEQAQKGRVPAKLFTYLCQKCLGLK